MSSTYSHANEHQGSSAQATVAISKAPPALEDKNASIEINPTPSNDDAAQRQIQLRSGVLIVSLHEGVGISLPEHYKQLLDGRNDQQSTESRPNTVPATAGFCLDSSNSHKSKTESSLREAGTFKRPAGGIYALLDFDKSQVHVPAVSGTVEHPLWAGHSCKFDLSHLMELSVYLYLKNALSTPGAGRIQDICLGVARFSPKLEEQDPNITELTIAELNQQNTISRQKWLELKHGTGKIRVSVDYTENKKQLLQMQDFDTLKFLGKGRSGKVFQVKSPYLAPEISLGQACTEVVDWWTLGILLAEMLTGLAPSWYDEDNAGMNSKIESFYFPYPDVVPPLAQDISIKLFNRDPEQRLGAKGVAEIKAHPFFNDVDWRKILQREYEPVFKPNDAHTRFDSNPQDLDFLPMSKEKAQKLSDKMIEQYRGMFAGWD